jgi:hypothetical protein
VAIVALALAATWLSVSQAAAEGPTIRLRPSATAPAFEVIGLQQSDLQALAGVQWAPDRWSALFGVYVEGQKTPPAMLGTWRIQDGVLRFEPRFPLRSGLRYRAVFDAAQLPGNPRSTTPLVAHFALPKSAPAPVTTVDHVFPTTNHLPENVLKFYIHFSAPMSRGDAYRSIHLYDAAGREVALPFLELDEELWDPQAKRFTLFFDPGRIKRGLKPREEAGPALEQGKTYTFVIDRTWSDGKGNPLKESYRKTFNVGPPDDQPPDPKTWKIQSPHAGTSASIVVTFPKPMDHALLSRLLWITDASGRKVPGSARITNHEACWQFTPRKAWSPGTYYLVAGTTLEDLAGNSIGRPFELDVLHPVTQHVDNETIRVPFQVGPSAVAK